jgi:hypothetical protein
MKAIIMCALLALAFGYSAFSQLWLQLNSPTTISEKAEDDFLRTVGKYIRRDYPDAEYRSRLATEAYFAAVPYNAQIFLDDHNRTWFSPPCLIANKIAPDSLKRIEKFVTEDRELGRSAKDFANLADTLLAILALSSGTDYQRTDVALSTMAQAHAAKNQHPDWHPDSVCSNAGGLLDERTLWG